MMNRKLVYTLAAAFFLTTGINAQITVKKIAIGSGIENGALRGENTTFSSSISTLYCLTHITGALNNPTLKHIWYYNGEQTSVTEFVVRSADFKTWSLKKMWHTWTGSWRVDLVDANNKVLASTSFTVK